MTSTEWSCLIADFMVMTRQVTNLDSKNIAE
jgi:hypothetical protein